MDRRDARPGRRHALDVPPLRPGHRRHGPRARLIDNRIGLAIEADTHRSEHIQSVIEDSVIRDDTSTPATCLIGIAQRGENLTANRLTITGQETGILVSQNDSSDSADFAGDSLEVVSGVTGVAIDGIESSLQLHNSTVRGQRAASVSIGALDSFVDISNNVLEAAPEGPRRRRHRLGESLRSRHGARPTEWRRRKSVGACR